MAKRWSFEEDCFICKFSFEHAAENLLGSNLADLMAGLKTNGFAPRSQVAVSKRFTAYQRIITEGDFTYASNQVKQIAEAYLSRVENPIRIDEINFNSYQNGITEDLMYDSNFCESQHPHLNHLVAIEPAAPSFRELLLFYIEKSGMKDSEVYRASYVSRDKFNHIINGRKGKKIKNTDNKNAVNASRETVIQLCIGLKLSYDDAVYLMACAGYAFKPNEDVERVVVACLRNGIRNINKVNVELYERNLEYFKEPCW